MSRSLAFALAIIFSLAFNVAVPAADENTAIMNPGGAVKSGVSVILGIISKIDTSDPSRIKIEVNGEHDNQLHIVEVAPSTSITKVTDISELKVGDAVRVMARKADNKEIAMGVMFGNLKKLPASKKAAAP